MLRPLLSSRCSRWHRVPRPRRVDGATCHAIDAMPHADREFLSMLPLVVNDARALLFMFDLSRRDTLASIKEWYRQCRGLNRTAHAILVGTKYDIFITLPPEEREAIDRDARRFARAMKAPVVFTSSTESINVLKLFKVILARSFGLTCTIPQLTEVGEPLLIF